MPPQETEEEPTPSTPRGATRRADDDAIEDAGEDDAVATKARVGRESKDERGSKRDEAPVNRDEITLARLMDEPEIRSPAKKMVRPNEETASIIAELAANEEKTVEVETTEHQYTEEEEEQAKQEELPAWLTMTPMRR